MARPETAALARILVVDDQPANIQLVGAALGKLGHEIIPASDGPTALRRLALRPPDLILLDLLMPEMDGCEVCRRIRMNPERSCADLQDTDRGSLVFRRRPCPCQPRRIRTRQAMSCCDR